MAESKETEPEAVGRAIMRPRARIISLLGDELISDEGVAVVELVKNAFDADATWVEVRFKGNNPVIPDTLVISDNGVGMTLDTVLTSWLEPGTVAKKKAERSKGGRTFQGAKGVGRFAAARLAHSMAMETKVEGAPNGVAVLLDWGKFDDNSYLDEIEIDYEQHPLKDLKHGTILTLMELRKKKEWSDTAFEELHDRLSRLISPFEEVKDFRIELVVPHRPDLTGVVVPHEITERPRYRLSGTLGGEGTFTGTLEVDGKHVRDFDKYALGKKGETVACGGFEVEFRAWDRDRQGLAPYMLEFNLGLRDIRRIIDAHCGISIYRDGFRVHPYGEAGNDWLGLDNRSRQAPTSRLANNQVIAAIRTSRQSNPGLIDRTTREGLVHNKHFSQLCEWSVRVLALLESERYRLRPREEGPSDEAKTLFEVFDLAPVVLEADRQLGTQHPIAVLVRKSDADIRDGVKRLQEHYSRLLMTAGIGQIVDLVIHEMGAPLGRVNRELAYLEKSLASFLTTDQARSVGDTIQDIKGWLEQLLALRNRLDPRGAGKRGRGTSFSVEDEIRGNLMLFENLIGAQKITVTVVAKTDDPIVVHMARSSLGQVLANLLDNSIHWLTRHHGDGNGGQIEIRLMRRDHGFDLFYSDNGPGISAGDREHVFDPYFSRKANGMGLGLYVARLVMERYGRISLMEESDLGGAGFHASFQRNVGL